MRPAVLQQQPGALAAAAAVATFEHSGAGWAARRRWWLQRCLVLPQTLKIPQPPDRPPLLQAAFCDVPTPSTWPALMQAPRMALYQGAEPPVVTALYTGARLPGC